jgi:hypothetical protein
MRSGEEIQGDLRKFASRWRDYSGSERSEAQTFLNELIKCYGADRKAAGARFEDAHTATGIMDLHWPAVCIVEMKAPHRADKLAEHRKQALDYWHSSDDAAENRAAPSYVVLCAFQRFEIWEPGRFPSAPRADFTLDELPENYEKLLFLAGTDQEPLFGDSYKELTTEAAKVVTGLYQALLLRKAAAPETLRSFLLQIVWCFFAEDLGMLEGHPTQRIVEDLVHHPERSSYAELGTLFDVLNDLTDYGRHGVLRGTRYVNGSLFAKAAKVHLTQDELLMLVEAAQFDWRKVDPTIFGSLMEGCLGRDRRWELGAHYTHEVDIMKIVRPTILEPWRNRIDRTKTVADVQRVLEELCAFRVLDPACGCGNFLYVAYRELRCLEHELKERLVRVAHQTGMQTPDPLGLPYYRLGNLRGIDIEPTAVLIARLTLWMGQRQMIDRFGPAEPALPLVDLSGIQVGDALERPWPVADCIIGNPPFLGASHVRAARGDAYVERLKTMFNVGVKDYCVYWFRKTHDHLGPNQRAGLVGTNSVSQNLGRSASLDYIVNNGGIITDAVSTQKWPGEAKVHVSLINWIKQPSTQPSTYILDGQPVRAISAELRTAERSTGTARRLRANMGKAFEGPSPKAKGFVIQPDEAERLLSLPGTYADVVRPYLGSADVARDVHQSASRWVIDFGVMSLGEAMRYPAALDIVRERVKAVREGKIKAYVGSWWQFNRPRRELRQTLVGLNRYIVLGTHGKRLLFIWAEAWTLSSNATKVFAFDDDYAMGVLTSRSHEAWAKSRSSSIKGDPRYTNTSCFETFPWPYPTTDEQRGRIAETIRKVIARRQQICAGNNFGLTTLYNLIDEGAYTDLKTLHRELDEAVAAAYGWPKAIAQDGDEIVQRLLTLNREIADGTRKYDPFEEELIFIPPPRTEVSRQESLTPEREPRHTGTSQPPGAKRD